MSTYTQYNAYIERSMTNTTVVSDNSTTITSKKSHNSDGKGNGKSSKNSRHFRATKCKSNIAYGLSSKRIISAKDKIKKDENSSSSVSDVHCKKKTQLL